MNEELTNSGLAESHSPETDKLARSITEMINAASVEHKEPAVEEKEAPVLPPELEKLLNEEVSFTEETEPEETEEASVTDEISEESEPAEEIETAEEAPLCEDEQPVVAEPEEEVSAKEEIAEAVAAETAEETAEESAEESAEEAAEEAVEAPAGEEITEETIAEDAEDPAQKEEGTAAEPVAEDNETETDVQTEAPISSEDITATDPDALFVKEPPSDGSRYLLTPDTDGDAFRGSIAEICDNIRVFLPDKQGCKIIAVTSAGRGEGKSSAALLLAMALASDKRVLLADCDFISPQLHKYFNCVNKKGVLNAADGELRLDDVALNTDMKGLKFVTAGLLPDGHDVDPVSVSACLTAEEGFDFIVCDLPSVNKSKYAAALAGAANGTVVVARIGVTGYPALTRALKKLRKADAYLLGAVLNGR